MKIPSLQEFLQSQGVDASTLKERVAQLKKTYRKSYHKLYYHERKKKGKRFSLNLTDEEYKKFQRYAKRHNQKHVGKFIKAAAVAYLEQQYVPRDTESIEKLTKTIGGIGNDINLIVQRVYLQSRRATNSIDDFQNLQKGYVVLITQVQEMQKKIKVYMVSPPKTLMVALREFLQDDSNKIQQLRTILNQWEQESKP